MDKKRKLHPNAEKHAEVLKRLGYLAPRLWDREEASKEHSLATEQWDEMLRLHIPGICFSDMPRMFELPTTMPNGDNGFTWSSLNDREFDRSRWNEVPAHFKATIEGWGNATSQILEGWTYESILPLNAVPRIHDEPNPRVYVLSGKMVRSAWKGDELRKRICALFEDRLLDLFRLSPNNLRKQYVSDRLQHHWELGGNAEAFLDYIEGMIGKWGGEAPTYFDIPQMKSLNVEDVDVLLRTIRKWIEERRKAEPKGVKVPPGSFTELWGKENLERLLSAMQIESIAYVTDGRGGKERIMAAFHAGAEKFGHPRHLMDWQGLLQSQYPGRVISNKVKPKDLDTASERYKGAYSAILQHLTE
jgi:hypothetical protein